MKIETRGYRQNGRGEVEATVAVLQDDNSFLLEDVVNLSRVKERRRFTRLISKRWFLPEDWVETQLLDLLAQARAALELQTTEGTSGTKGDYQVIDGQLCWMRGSVATPLANFAATITEDIIRDNGLEEERVFKLKGTLASGEPLQDAKVTASSFASMNWVPACWGARAAVAAGLGLKDRLREAIQLISGEMPRRHVFIHTGWRIAGADRVYLHAGGAIGGEGIETEMEDAMLRFCLPTNPEDAKGAMEASLRILQVAPLRVTAPLWGAIWLAVLAEILRPDFTVWLHGPTGNLKSSLAALAQSHFGQFDRRSFAASFQDTRNYMEKICFLAKDALLVVDDYHPAASKETAREMEQTALRLLRSQGNLQGRGRMRPDTSTRPAYPPRGLVVVTGEQLPSGQSTNARFFAVEVDRREVKLEALMLCQQDAFCFPHALASYVIWVKNHWDELASELPKAWHELRSSATGAGTHLRLPEAVAHLALGVDCGLRFAEEIGALSVDRGTELRKETWESLLETAEAQGLRVHEERPTVIFLEIISELLQQKRIYLKGVSGDEPPDPDELGWIREVDINRGTIWLPRPGSDPVGWADDNFLYLMPDDIYRRAARFATEQSSFFPVKALTLWRHLVQEGIVVKGKKGRNTVVEWLEGRTRRVLKMKRGALTPEAEK